MITTTINPYSPEEVHQTTGIRPWAKVIYLATPYSCKNKWFKPFLQWARFYQVNKAAAYLMKLGYVVFSPISHSHPIAKASNIGSQDHDFWLTQDQSFLQSSDIMVVYKQAGWKKSRGVLQEIEWAKNWGIPVVYMEVLRKGISPFAQIEEEN